MFVTDINDFESEVLHQKLLRVYKLEVLEIWFTQQ